MKPALTALLFLAVACKTDVPKSISAPRPATVDSFLLADSAYAVLTYRPTWGYIFEGAQPAQLSGAELADIERIVRQATADFNDEVSAGVKPRSASPPEDSILVRDLTVRLDGTMRQYVAVTNARGEKEVWINFVCGDREPIGWTTKPYIVTDGGSCYFNLKVNLTTNTYSDLSVNGEA